MESFIEATLETIDYDSLFEIFEKLDPKDVFNLCQTSVSIANFCSIDKLWEDLMKIHYPNFDLTDNPRQQYKSLTLNIASEYEIEYDVENWEVFTDSEGNTLRMSDISSKAFYIRTAANIIPEKYVRSSTILAFIKGEPFQKDEKLWVVITDDYDKYETKSKVFRTKDDAIDYMIEQIKTTENRNVSKEYLQSNEIYWVDYDTESEYKILWILKEITFLK